MAGHDSSYSLGFLDHALRQGPSERMHLIKRSFFNEHSQTKHLNNCSEAIKGIYSAIRLNSVCIHVLWLRSVYSLTVE